MPLSAGHDRREYPRHPARAIVRVKHANRISDGHLLDVSFNGARLIATDPDDLQEGDEISIAMLLEDLPSTAVGEILSEQAKRVLRLRGTLVYRRDETIGVEYRPLSEVDQVLLTLLLARPED